jgi:hypothetical protein
VVSAKALGQFMGKALRFLIMRIGACFHAVPMGSLGIDGPSGPVRQEFMVL